MGRAPRAGEPPVEPRDLAPEASEDFALLDHGEQLGADARQRDQLDTPAITERKANVVATDQAEVCADLGRKAELHALPVSGRAPDQLARKHERGRRVREEAVSRAMPRTHRGDATTPPPVGATRKEVDGRLGIAVGYSVMAPVAPVMKRPPRNNHAVALANRNHAPRGGVGRGWSKLMRREYAQWMVQCRTAKQRGLPKPEPPWFLTMQRALERITLAERCERMLHAARTAYAAFTAHQALLSHRPGPISETARVHCQALLGAVEELMVLSGAPEQAPPAPPPAREPVVLTG